MSSGTGKYVAWDEEDHRMSTYACGDVMPVDCVAGADAGEAEGAVSVQAERFFDDGAEVREALEGVVFDVFIGSKGGADLAF